ncbi:formylglycine-generating enzyme family protein [Marinihelvus fidelis]|nr:formylglycine-generating enzyme family protein [Marinihelvus fidelis]
MPGTMALAQQSSTDTDSDSGSAETPVKRLGDVAGEDYSIGFDLPAAKPEERGRAMYELPDHSQNARLQSILSRLATRPGNPQALKELQSVLREALVLADDFMNEGDLDEAAQVLSVIRNVDPNTSGLGAATQRLNDLVPDNAARRAPQKRNTVDSVSPYNLPDPTQTARLDELLSILATRPRNGPALRELDALLNDVLRQAEVAREAGDYERAERLNRVVRSVNPRKSGLAESREGLETARQVDDLLAAAAAARRAGALIEPPLESAYYYWRRVVELDRTNPEAAEGLAQVQQAMVDNAMAAAQNDDEELAEQWLEEASAVRESQELVVDARLQMGRLRDEQAQSIENQVISLIHQGDYQRAEFLLIDLIALGGYEHRVAGLRDMIAREQVYGSYEPGQVIRDHLRGSGARAPAVIVIGAGGFQMGAAADDEDAVSTERPAHRVNFQRAFAIGINEVTVGEFRDFIRATNYRTDAERDRRSDVWDDDLGQLASRGQVDWQLDYAGRPATDQLPVLHVSWNDAQEYVRWLSQVTGERYRLPSEAEFEYALRAGTHRPWWWGSDRPRDAIENLAGEHDKSASSRRFSNYIRGYGDGYWGPAPVGVLSSNAWGLYDMAGNVAEWVQDCWHVNYVRAPADGSAWENPGCDRRVVRGAYWASSLKQARSSARLSVAPDLHTPQVGFRVARDL